MDILKREGRMDGTENYCMDRLKKEWRMDGSENYGQIKEGMKDGWKRDLWID